MRHLINVILSVMLVCLLSSCGEQNDNFIISNQEVQSNFHKTTYSEKAIGKLPDGDFLIEDLYPDNVSKIKVQYSSGWYGSYVISIENPNIIDELLDEIGKNEITDSFEPIFMFGDYDLSLSIYENEVETVILKENSEYMTFDVTNVKYKKTYSVKDEELRKNRVIMSALNCILQDHQLKVNGEANTLSVLPLYVEGEGYEIVGEDVSYIWQIKHLMEFDFSQCSLLINDEKVTEFPDESGEYYVIVSNDKGTYHLRYVVE